MLVGFTVRLLPVPTSVPPHDPLYQLAVAPVPADPPVNDRVVAPPEQTVAAVAAADVGAVEAVLTVTVTDAQVVLPLHGDGSSYLT